MTAPFDDAAVERAAKALCKDEWVGLTRDGWENLSTETRELWLVRARSALTAALAPEPTPLERAGFALFELEGTYDREDGAAAAEWVKYSQSDRNEWMSEAKDIIDAYLAASGPAPRRLTAVEWSTFKTAFSCESGPTLRCIRRALAAINIEVDDA